MVSWNDLERWKAKGMQAVGDELVNRLRKLRVTESELRDAATPREWGGVGAAAARKSFAGIEEGLQDTVAEFAALGRAVDDAADRIEHGIERAVAQVKDAAAGHDLDIVDGKVVPRAGANFAEPGRSAPDTHVEVRAALEQQIAQILRTAADIDADLTVVMLAIAGGEIDDGGADTMAQAARSGAEAGAYTAIEPPKNATPAENRAWWKTLSDAERNWLIQNKPDLIGNRKGLPYADRSMANQVRIGQARGELEAKRKELLDNPPKRWSGNVESIDTVALNRMLDEIDGKLRGLDVLESQAADGNVIAALDTNGERLRASVAIGDLDNAEYATVYTPGMNSAVEDNMDRYVDEMRETKGYADEMLKGSGMSTAVLVNMDYEPPKANLAEGLEGISDERAKVGAERLASELDGLRASRDEPPERVTAIGHSYGSLTTGLALKQTDAADVFLSQGSPGYYGSEGLKVSDGVYDTAASGDPVARSGAFGWYSPGSYDGVTSLSPEAATGSAGEELHRTSGHTSYTAADGRQSTSEYNTAALMSGRDDLLIEGTSKSSTPPVKAPPR